MNAVIVNDLVRPGTGVADHLATVQRPLDAGITIIVTKQGTGAEARIMDSLVAS